MGGPGGPGGPPGDERWMKRQGAPVQGMFFGLGVEVLGFAQHPALGLGHVLQGSGSRDIEKARVKNECRLKRQGALVQGLAPTLDLGLVMLGDERWMKGQGTFVQDLHLTASIGRVV